MPCLARAVAVLRPLGEALDLGGRPGRGEGPWLRARDPEAELCTEAGPGGASWGRARRTPSWHQHRQRSKQPMQEPPPWAPACLLPWQLLGLRVKGGRAPVGCASCARASVHLHPRSMMGDRTSSEVRDTTAVS